MKVHTTIRGTAIRWLAIPWLALWLSVAALADLPRIHVEHFGPGIREQIGKAYEGARKAPRDANAAGKLGMVLHTYEEHELASACYQHALTLAPNEFQWLYLLGVTQMTLGKNDEAIVTLRDALRRKNNFIPAQLRLADLLFATGDLEASRHLYEEITGKRADLAQAWYGLGRALAQLGEKTAAIERLRKACELSPRYGAAHYALAMAYRDAGNKPKASEHFQLYQQHKLIRPFLADPLMNAVAELNAGAAERLKRGVELAEAGQLSEAIAEHERAVEINPQFAQARINLIQLYGRTKQPDKAEEQYRAIVAINPNLADSHYNFGVLMVEQGKYEEAAAAFRRSLEINPFHAEAHLNYGAALERRQMYDEALQHYQQAVEHRPSLRQAHFQYARMLLYKGRMEEAIAELRHTITVEDEQTPRFLYALAAAYARAGDRANGLKYAREARTRAAALKQTELLAAIERDLKTLEEGK